MSFGRRSNRNVLPNCGLRGCRTRRCPARSAASHAVSRSSQAAGDAKDEEMRPALEPARRSGDPVLPGAGDVRLFQRPLAETANLMEATTDCRLASRCKRLQSPGQSCIRARRNCMETIRHNSAMLESLPRSGWRRDSRRFFSVLASCRKNPSERPTCAATSPAVAKPVHKSIASSAQGVCTDRMSASPVIRLAVVGAEAEPDSPHGKVVPSPARTTTRRE